MTSNRSNNQLEIIKLTNNKLHARTKMNYKQLQHIKYTLLGNLETLRVSPIVDPGYNTSYMMDETLEQLLLKTPLLPDTSLDAVFVCEQTGGLLTSDSFRLVSGSGGLYPGIFYFKLDSNQRVNCQLRVQVGTYQQSALNKSYSRFTWLSEEEYIKQFNKDDVPDPEYNVIIMETIALPPLEVLASAIYAPTLSS